MQGVWIVAFVLQWIALLVLLLLVAGLFRYLGSIQERIDLATPRATRFELGGSIDHFVLADLQGRSIESKNLLERKSLLLFVSANCNACKTTLKQIAELARREGGLKGLGWGFIFICYGAREKVEEMFQEYLPTEDITVLVDNRGVVSSQFGIKSIPVGIAIDEQCRVLDQSFNPHAAWLYHVLDTPAPLHDPIPLETFMLSNS